MAAIKLAEAETYGETGAGALMRPQMIVPPGWVWLSLEGDRKRTITELFREAWANVPRDSVGPFIRRLEATMLESLEEAAAAGGVAVVMPIGVPWQVPVSASIALSLVPAGIEGPELPRGHRVTTDAGEAARLLHEVPVPAAADPEQLVVLRTIDMTWIAPEGDAYLLAAATISGLPVKEYEPVTEALTTLIDAMLAALTWEEQSDDTAS